MGAMGWILENCPGASQSAIKDVGVCGQGFRHPDIPEVEHVF